MQKKELISQIYKILLLYEDAINTCSSVQEKDYLGYLDRIYVYWRGVGCDEIFNTIKGLHSLSLDVEHHIVKSMVFHMIDIIQKGGTVNGI